MKHFSRIGIVFGMLVFGLSAIFSGNAIADDGYQIISTRDLEQWLQVEQKPFLVFALSEVEFEEAHIPDSVCIPMEMMGTLGKLPDKFTTPLVFYCHGPG